MKVSNIAFISLYLVCTVFYSVVGQQASQNQDTAVISEQGREGASSYDEAVSVDATGTAVAYSQFLFSSSGVINSLSQTVNTVLLKGNTVSWDVVAKKRYAAVVQSSTLDTAIRLNVDGITVYRDLYLGEQAGIVFSPVQDSTVQLTAFANTTFFSYDAETFDGSYVMKVYEVQAEPDVIEQFPYNSSSRIDEQHSLALRKAREYTITLQQDVRVYIRLFSDVFDPLLELSDTYGRSITSDDWQGDESIITLLSPKTDDYFITVSSFDGNQSGAYTLFATTSNNEIFLEESSTISQSDTQLLSQYYKEYSITMGEKDFRALDIHALDGDITIAFTTKEKQTIVQYDVAKKQRLSLPLFVSKRGEYLIVLLSSTPAIVNYTLTIYK